MLWRNKVVAVFFATLVVASCAGPLEPSRIHATLHEFQKINQDYHKELCPAGTEQTYDRLLTRYRGKGFYIPEIGGDIDTVTVTKLLPELKEKHHWIQSRKAALAKIRQLPQAAHLTKKTLSLVNQLLELKKSAVATTDQEQVKLAAKSFGLIKELSVEFEQVMRRVPFLVSYSFPVDHLKNRKIYDEFKDRRDATSQSIANYAFFYRKVVEDGAYNPDHTGSDLYLRSTLDTIHYELARQDAFISETLRYDLEWAMKRIDAELARGQKALLARLQEWDDRVARQIVFYDELVRPENREKAKAIVKEHNLATIELKRFVHERQRDSFLFWRRQNEVMKALFVMDTILFNEVGRVDGADALERIDVAQVVMNRKDLEDYRRLDIHQDLWPYLKAKLSDLEIQNEEWLNVLYRQGEFSFTYYYIPGVVKLFCGDNTLVGKQLQKENLVIALTTLRSPRKDFTPVRYFSRASMLGHIDMSSIWENFLAYPERVGLISEGQTELLAQWKAGKARFLYAFQDPKQITYWAVEIKNKIYGVRAGEKPVFFNYRDPHLFVYFDQKTETQNSKKPLP